MFYVLMKINRAADKVKDQGYKIERRALRDFSFIFH